MEDSKMISSHNPLERTNLERTIKVCAQEESIIKWDLSASSSVDTSVQVDKGEPKQRKYAQRNSIMVRVWNKQGLVGITSTSDLTEKGLRKALIGAHNASSLGNRNDIPDFSPSCKDPLPDLEKRIFEKKPIDFLFDRLREAESDLLSINKLIKSIPYNGLSESTSERIYLNSDYAFRRMKQSQCSIYLYALAQEEGRKPRSSGAIRLAAGFEELDMKGCIKEAAERTLSHLNYKPVKTGKYLVCFTPESFLELIGAFSNIFNARSILDGVSISNKDSIGSTITVPFMNLWDNGLHPSNIGSSSFDGEGTPTSKLCLIKNGILENFLHSEATARAFGVKPTGHAGIGAKVSVGPDWFDIKADDTVQGNNLGLLEEDYPGEYVLVEGLNALHSGVKSSQGSFSLPFDGWLVKDNQRESIEAATIAGDIKQLLMDIVGIEKMQKVTHSGVCPNVWVDGLSITGEA